MSVAMKPGETALTVTAPTDAVGGVGASVDDGPAASPLPQATPTAPGDLPDVFHALLWSALLGEDSDVLAAAVAGGFSTSISPVRFA